MAPARLATARLVAKKRLSDVSLVDGLTQSLTAAPIDHARAMAHEVVIGWWQALSRQRRSAIPASPCPVRLPPLSDETRIQARKRGAALALVSVAAAVDAIGRLYTHALPFGHRSANGIFYTPPELVRRLLDRATLENVDWRTARAISPSCGGGAFLIEDAARMASAMALADPAIIVASIGSRLVGWDRDPFACWLSQVAVEAVLLEQISTSGKRLAKITECRDSLMDDWAAHAGHYDLVNDNPAFGKVRKTDELTRRFARSQRGHMNIYGLFIDLAVHLAKDQTGVIAYLTPTSYLAGDYFAKLRSLLSSEARPSSIDLVESRQDVFPDVLQEVALSVFVRDGKKTEAKGCCVHVEPSGLRIEDVGKIEIPPKSEAPWLIARNPESIPVISTMHGMTTRLADWGYQVKTGPLVPHKNRSRMLSTKAKGTVPVVWAESISSTGGRFEIRCERTGRKAWYLPKTDSDSNVTTGGALLLQRTTAKEQARRLIGAIMSSEAVTRAGGRVAVENHVNMVVPSVPRPAVSMEQLAAFFASDAADQAFRCISGSVAVSATELEALPLPSSTDLLAALASGDTDLALRRLYGISHGRTNPAQGAKKSARGALGSSRAAVADAADGAGCP